MSAGTGGKNGYHHGNLQNALVDAATELARDGGPEAVVLREAARRVGVSATAAYRHFANQADLLLAVKIRAQEALAARMGGRMRTHRSGDAECGRGRLYDLGRGYLEFALAEPGLYRTAFCHVRDRTGDDPWEAGDEAQYLAFNLLTGLLDELEGEGVLRPGARPNAEFGAWATVHGLAMLVLDGPLATFPARERDAVIDRTIAMVVAGLTPA